MSSEYTIETDVLVVGGGMAGFFAAIKAKEQGLDVTLTDKAYVGKAGSTHFSEGDIVYFRPQRGHDVNEWVDIISRGCEYINNREWDEICLKEAEARYNDLISWGIQFYEKDGKLYIFGPGERQKGYEAITQMNRKYAPTLRKKALESGVRVMDRIMLCERIGTLDFYIWLAVACNAVEKDGFFNGRNQGVTNPTEHGMERPDRQLVFSSLSQFSNIVQEIGLSLLRIDSQRTGNRRIKPPLAGLDILQRNQGIDLRMLSLFIHQVNRMEDLDWMMGIHGQGKFCDPPQVMVDKMAQAVVILNGCHPSPPTNEQLKSRDAEGVLHIHQQQVDFEGILICGKQAVVF